VAANNGRRVTELGDRQNPTAKSWQNADLVGEYEPSHADGCQRTLKTLDSRTRDPVGGNDSPDNGIEIHHSTPREATNLVCTVAVNDRQECCVLPALRYRRHRQLSQYLFNHQTDRPVFVPRRTAEHFPVCASHPTQYFGGQLGVAPVGSRCITPGGWLTKRTRAYSATLGSGPRFLDKRIG